MSAHRDRFAGVTVKAVEQVAAVSGGLHLFWDVVHAMHKVPEQDRTDADVLGSLIAGWVKRFDVIGNALTASNDELIEALQRARIPSVLCIGSVVFRSTLSQAYGEGRDVSGDRQDPRGQNYVAGRAQTHQSWQDDPSSLRHRSD